MDETKIKPVSATESPGFWLREIIGDAPKKLGNFVAVNRDFLVLLFEPHICTTRIVKLFQSYSSTHIFYATAGGPS
jgi:hypothetical protein